ncbi:GTPase activating protein [Boothiomyces sp. JEL0866]|nr:GTPase activating protein [Boothiomyces sp. JEL0866]
MDGILALVTDKVNVTLAWIVLESLNREQLNLFHIPKQSGLVDLKQIESFSTPVDSIISISLEPELSVYNNKACCLVAMTVFFTAESGEESQWPALIFNPTSLGIQSVADVHSMLRRWLRPFKRDLVYLDDGKNRYYLTDKLQNIVTEKWPAGIPQPPEDSSVYKIGAFGFGVVSSLLGSPTAHKLEDVGWDVLERFAQVTIFAKDKTTQALEHPLARPLLPLIPDKIRSNFLTSAEAEALIEDYDSAHRYLAQFADEIQRKIGIKKDIEVIKEEPDTTCDFENLKGHYVSHFTGTPITTEKWSSWLNEDGKLNISSYKVACHGIEPALRPTAWKYILGATLWTEDEQTNENLLQQKKDTYYKMKNSWMVILQEAGNRSPTKLKEPHNGPVGDEDENSDVISKLTERKYRIDKDVIRTDQTIPFFTAGEINPKNTLHQTIETQPNLVTLRNILMTYTILNFELGYVQGMSDLAAPILEIVKDEAEAFWCYVGLMEKMKQNFQRDQSGMQNQLRKLELLLKVLDPPLYRHFENCDSVNMFCCFRWLLIAFKREFYFEDIKTLWEIVWMSPLTAHFNLFVAVAILNQHRKPLLETQAFDEVLKYINNLSQNINVPEVVQRAEVLYYILRDKLATNGPEGLGESVGKTVSSIITDADLNVISGRENKILVLDQTEYKKDSNVTAEEWYELVQVFEIDQSIANKERMSARVEVEDGADVQMSGLESVTNVGQ